MKMERDAASKGFGEQKQKYADMPNKTNAEAKAAGQLREQVDIFSKIVEGNGQLRKNLIQAGLHGGINFKDVRDVQNGSGPSSSKSGMTAQGGSDMNDGVNMT